MMKMAIAGNRKVVQISSIVGLPGLGFPDDTLEANTAHMNIYLEMLRRFPAAAAEFKDFEPVFFYIIYSESYLVSKRRMIRVPADVKGVKVGSNGIRQELVSKLGAAPVWDIPPTSCEKMQKGPTDYADRLGLLRSSPELPMIH